MLRRAGMAEEPNAHFSFALITLEVIRCLSNRWNYPQ